MKSLAVKYRPSNFDDLTDQESIKKILSYQVNTGTIKNGYLFTGPAGCGKTTSARIFADMINEENSEIIELDAASNNSVDDIRTLCEQAQSRSMISEYKIFILDEVHVLSGAAWQAMLKTLEEPPAKSIFILCTTNPEKIPATILSRVQRYNFQRIGFTGIVDRLNYILTAEQNEENESYTVEKDAIELIAKMAQGGMRDAITLLDKCLSYSKTLSVESVTNALGLPDYDNLIRLYTAVLNKSDKDILENIEDVYRSGVDLKIYMGMFFDVLIDIVKYNQLGNMEYLKLPNSTEEFLKTTLKDVPDVLTILKEVMDINYVIKWEKDIKDYIEARLILLGESTV